MFNEPRNWKWAVPLLLEPVFLLATYWLIQAQWTWVQLLGFVPGMAMIVMLILAVNNFIRYQREWQIDVFERTQRALSTTATSVLLDAAKNVHPDTLVLLFKDRARRWGLVSGTKSLDEQPYSVLESRPRVTDRFVVHFLRMSNSKTYMPKHLLSDGDKSFDPQRVVTAYEMYDDLESLLIDEMKVTRPMGKYKSGYWLAGWDPDAVALDFGIDLDDWKYEDDEIKETNNPEFIQNSMKDLIPLTSNTSSIVRN